MKPKMEDTKHQLDGAAIRRIAFDLNIPANLLLAIISVESSNNPSAVRAEPKYRYLWDCEGKHPFRKISTEEICSNTHPKGFSAECGSVDTEWWGQKMSWGPMQIMGAVAREYGFLGHFPVLCGTLGIKYGAIHLSTLSKRYLARFGWDGVIAAYNAGSPRLQEDKFVNQYYVDKVNSHMKKAKK